MSATARIESADLKGTGRSGRAGDLAVLMAAAHRFADIHDGAGRLDERRLAGNQREFASPKRVAATAAQQPPRPRTECSTGIDRLCRLCRQHFGGAAGRCGSQPCQPLRQSRAQKPVI